ncbi:hypothetical protein ACIF8T_22920 [Streptomyces sp. NPDC085946]|uniref:hypothetical protein n=1 Tax=Streptomyces sp. NPDC085946 TaxID=3365744 RepID=UPI0037CD4670
MNAQRARRLLAASAVGVLMAGGATIGAAGTASAATPAVLPTQVGSDWCDRHGWQNENCHLPGGIDNTVVVVVVVA